MEDVCRIGMHKGRAMHAGATNLLAQPVVLANAPFQPMFSLYPVSKLSTFAGPAKFLIVRCPMPLLKASCTRVVYPSKTDY